VVAPADPSRRSTRGAPAEVSGASRACAGVVLRATGIEKSFRRGLLRRRSVDVLRGASLEIGAGELVGLVGENGSGKSVLIKILVGFMARDAGDVEIAGRLGYCPQSPLVWAKLTVREHFRLFGEAYGLEPSEAAAARDQLLEELRFDRYADYRVEELSGGTRQKLNLALALMHEPDLLLLDEPYSGFDWETYLHFWEMSEARRANGMAILVVSHLLAERERLSRVYALEEGRCREE
jgi:ABC-2 type transport system ATP-binding protein